MWMETLKNKYLYSKAGFSLVELLMALATSTIVLGAIYSVFNITNKNVTTQNVAANMQQSLRSAIGLMARDIRIAGLDPVGTGNFGILEATVSKIIFTQDSIDSGTGEYNGEVDDSNSEKVTYYFEERQIRQKLYDDPDYAVLISNIDAMEFSYLDADGNDLGNPVADLDLIRTVVIYIKVKEPAGRDEPVERTLTRKVECRNLGFN